MKRTAFGYTKRSCQLLSIDNQMSSLTCFLVDQFIDLQDLFTRNKAFEYCIFPVSYLFFPVCLNTLRHHIVTNEKLNFNF